jgi:hypothetical protein
MLGMSGVDHYSLVEITCKKWPKNGSDPNDNEYELPILKYNVNQEALTNKQKEPQWRRME